MSILEHDILKVPFPEVLDHPDLIVLLSKSIELILEFGKQLSILVALLRRLLGCRGVAGGLHLHGLRDSAALSALVGRLHWRLPIWLHLHLLLLEELLLHHLRGHWLDRLPSVEPRHLLLQILVLHFQELNLPL